MPPKTHNLRYLAQLSGAEIPQEIFDFLSMLSDISIPTRYPEDFGKLVEAYDQNVARKYADKSKEVFEWIRRSLEP